MEDNWKHRSEEMSCKTCMWYVAKKANAELINLDEKMQIKSSTTVKAESAIGRCRKHAPSLNGWPAVFKTDWCGDHKIDENKING